MKKTFIKSKCVCMDNGKFIMTIGFQHYNLGFQILDWGIRLMLINYHLCFHFKIKNKKGE
jgi:hypothetical protein